MSTYDSSGPGQEPPSDPWIASEQTAPVSPAPPPVSGPPVSVPPVSSPPVSVPPVSGPPVAAVPPPTPPTPPTFQPGHAQPQPPYNQYQQPQYQPSQFPANPYSADHNAPTQYQQGQYQPAQYQGQYQPNQYHQGYEQAAPHDDYGDQAWQAPAAKRNTAVIVLSILLALVVIAGLGVGAYLFAHRGTTAKAAIPAAGQCVQTNNRPEPDTTVSVVACAPGALRVLKTITGTDQVSECDGVSGLTNVFHFTAVNAPLADNYVLCLGSSS